MPEVSLIGVHTAGGLITGAGHGVNIDGAPVAVVGDPVVPHAPCPDVPSHCSAVMASGSRGVTIDGIPIIRAGDPASCGHGATGLAGVTDTPP